MSSDQELRRALRPEDPPAGFVERVLARVADAQCSADVGPASPAFSRRYVRWTAVAAAASLLIAIGASRYYAYRQMAAEAARVQHDVNIALLIASEKLTDVQAKLKELSLREF